MKITNVNELVNKYIEQLKDYNEERNSLLKRRDERQRQIERIDKKLKRLGCPSWIDSLVKPMAEAMLKNMPDRTYDILGPFGMSSLTSIHFYKKGINEKEKFTGNNCVSITFVPRNLNKGELMVKDYTVNTGQFKLGTIGEMNGYNYPDVKLKPDIGWLMKWLEKQNKKKR